MTFNCPLSSVAELLAAIPGRSKFQFIIYFKFHLKCRDQHLQARQSRQKKDPAVTTYCKATVLTREFIMTTIIISLVNTVAFIVHCHTVCIVLDYSIQKFLTTCFKMSHILIIILFSLKQHRSLLLCYKLISIK